MTAITNTPLMARCHGALSSPKVWVSIALVMSMVALLEQDPGASPLWWTLPLLFGAYLWAWRRRGRALRLSRRAAAATYVVSGLAAGVVYELSLSTDGTGLGGLHADTFTSFLLLPGYLLPAVLFTFWMVRRYGLDQRETFFVAGGMSWYEMLSMGAGYVAATPWVAPVLVAFYVASYAVYNGALGVLLVDPAALWAPTPRRIGTGRQMLYSVVGGAGAWACFLGWATIVQ